MSMQGIPLYTSIPPFVFFVARDATSIEFNMPWYYCNIMVIVLNSLY